jgi:hypothetical protein
MVWGWLRPKKKSKVQERDEKAHPFDRAAREVNDALADLKKTTAQLEEDEARREAFEEWKRLKG